tara:strand:- start:4819 stop:6132 length:1314 start_codon:yes stop_codon:yes gene_type:complete
VSVNNPNQKYERYKKIGEDWLDAVPEHWEFRRVKTFLRLVAEPAPKNNDFELLSVYTDIGVRPRKELEEKGNKASTTDGYWLVQEGDFIVNKLLAWMGAVGISNYSGVTSPAYDILRPRENIAGNFYHYMFRMNTFSAVMKKSSRGIMDMRLRLYFDKFGDIRVPFPPYKEQLEIAKFLDQKAEQIDEAIAIKEKQIALLKERKQIIIQQAITQGLDHSVSIKESGVDWIGQIPEHWKVEKLFGLCRFVRGNSNFSKDELLSRGQYVALQYGKTYKVNEIDERFDFYVGEEFYKESQVVNFGDVIFISTSETMEDLGHSAIYNREEVGLLGGEQILIKPNSDLLDNFYTYYSTSVFSKELRKYATGIKVFRFNINDLKTIYLAIPPLEEQRIIVQHISVQSKKIDQAVLLQESLIEKLKEYKTTLINNAVTGKIKVA